MTKFIYGEGKEGSSYSYNKRQTYTDYNGNDFTGYREEALAHYRKLFPSDTIQISYYPKKRGK